MAKWQNDTRLVHYTNATGIKGILETNTLWATHFRFLNDEQEIVCFTEYLSEQLYKLSKEKKEKWPKYKIREMCGRIHERFFGLRNGLNRSFLNTYITSFCLSSRMDPYSQENGLLSQWRGYGRDGGYAVEFLAKDIEKLIRKNRDQFNHIRLNSVIYQGQDERAENLLGKDINGLYRLLKNLNFKETDPTRKLASVFEGYIKCACRFKHQGFEEEKEVRIASSIYWDEGKSKGEQYRVKDGFLIPYITLFQQTDEDDCLPIKRIIVGPHRNQEKHANAIRHMINEADIEIYCSKTPFIG